MYSETLFQNTRSQKIIQSDTALNIKSDGTGTPKLDCKYANVYRKKDTKTKSRYIAKCNQEITI